MKDSPLVKIFRELGQGAKGSVQNGRNLDELDKYLHVKRPVDDLLRQKMRDIENAGGGLVLLTGSAGDGKSHLISCLKGEGIFTDFIFYNDATESYSPSDTATQTLKLALSEFQDCNIASTSRKMVLAINFGKLNEFIEDNAVIESYGQLIKVVSSIFNDDDAGDGNNSDRIKVVQFTNQQIYEIRKDSDEEYPVNSHFLSSILKKITNRSEDNPFYKAYKVAKSQSGETIDPAVLNYELLSIPMVQNTIVKMCIEAIIRFQLMLTPRDFLDFVYRIVVYDDYRNFTVAHDFFKALLPTLIYSYGDNRILQSLYYLDPLKYSSSDHDKDLALLFTAINFPEQYFSQEDYGALPQAIIKNVNAFYGNGEKNVTDLSEFLLRLKHLMHYHSESAAYKEFLKLYCECINNDTTAYLQAYSLVNQSIIRHYGSYYEKDNLVPLNIQGSKFRLFAHVHINMEKPDVPYRSENVFYPYLLLKWTVHGKNETITLKLDYDLYGYLKDLGNGMLNVNYENDTNMEFNHFIGQLIDCSDKEKEVVILDDENKENNISYQFGVLIFK